MKDQELYFRYDTTPDFNFKFLLINFCMRSEPVSTPKNILFIPHSHMISIKFLSIVSNRESHPQLIESFLFRNALQNSRTLLLFAVNKSCLKSKSVIPYVLITYSISSRILSTDLKRNFLFQKVLVLQNVHANGHPLPTSICTLLAFSKIDDSIKS